MNILEMKRGDIHTHTHTHTHTQRSGSYKKEGIQILEI